MKWRVHTGDNPNGEEVQADHCTVTNGGVLLFTRCPTTFEAKQQSESDYGMHADVTVRAFAPGRWIEVEELTAQ